MEAGVAISAHPINLDFGKLNNTKGLVQEVGLGGEQNFIYPGNLKKDEVAQFNLLSIPDNPAPAPPEEPSPIGSSLTFHWGSSDTRADDAGAGPDTWKTAAIEVTIIYCNPCVAPPGTSTFRLKKVAFDPIDRGNNFSPLNPPFGTVGRQTISDSRSEKDFYFHANVDVTALIGSYPANTPVLARVRFLYNNIDSPIAVTAAGTIPTEGSLIESIGQTSSGVTRRLQAVRLYPPPLPIPFDYVLFSKGDIIK